MGHREEALAALPRRSGDRLVGPFLRAQPVRVAAGGCVSARADLAGWGPLALSELRQRLRRGSDGGPGAGALPTILVHLQQLRVIWHNLLPEPPDRGGPVPAFSPPGSPRRGWEGVGGQPQAGVVLPRFY